MDRSMPALAPIRCTDASSSARTTMATSPSLHWSRRATSPFWRPASKSLQVEARLQRWLRHQEGLGEHRQQDRQTEDAGSPLRPRRSAMPFFPSSPDLLSKLALPIRSPGAPTFFYATAMKLYWQTEG